MSHVISMPDVFRRVMVGNLSVCALSTALIMETMWITNRCVAATTWSIQISARSRRLRVRISET